MKYQAVIFWIVFTALSVLGQSLLPGVDLLAAGLVVGLQEERRSGALWLLVLFILLQEGMGSLPFGHALLWYVFISLFFLLGRWMFEARNIFFILMMGAGLGVAHFVLLYVMAALQDWTLYLPRLIRESALQAAIFPVQWLLVRLAYLGVVPHVRKV